MDNDVSQIILDELRAHRVESRERHEAIEKRVRDIEGWQSNANGKITAFGLVGVALGGLVTLLASFFKH